jgi:hypothetical protein
LLIFFQFKRFLHQLATCSSSFLRIRYILQVLRIKASVGVRAFVRFGPPLEASEGTHNSPSEY